MSSGSLHYADWHSVKTQSHPTVSDLSHHLIQIFRRFASGEILWPSLVRVKPHRAAACVTFGSFFKPKENLSMDWAGFYRPWCSGTESTAQSSQGFSYCCGYHVKGESSLQTKGLQNKSLSKFIARKQKYTATLFKFQLVCNFVRILSIGQEHWIAWFFKE